jgi:uncharacterized protein (DUF924 family)
MLLDTSVINEIFTFWFPNDNYNNFWFDKNLDFDSTIKTKYFTLLKDIFALIKNYDLFGMTSDELIAIIIILDQFSRNIERTITENESNLLSCQIIHEMTEEAFRLSKFWINHKCYLTEPINKIVFALMPLRHLNRIHDYNIIIQILDEIKDKYNGNILYNKFKNQTIKRLELLK